MDKEFPSSIDPSPERNGFVAGGALLLSEIHGDELDISANERERYLLKSLHFALYFSGFSQTGRVGELMGAARAAFLCCAYDVITDWRKFDPQYLPLFTAYLDRYATEELKQLALDLYRKDQNTMLEDDGLERGWIALRFIVELMGIREQYEQQGIDIRHVGRILQIVDDVLDFEEDRNAGETNCLLSEHKTRYLLDLIESDVNTLFPPDTPLQVAIAKAREKAEGLLRQSKHA